MLCHRFHPKVKCNHCLKLNQLKIIGSNLKILVINKIIKMAIFLDTENIAKLFNLFN